MKAIFRSDALIEEIDRKTNTNQELYIKDIVTGNYYRCFGVEYDEKNNLILKTKSLNDLYKGR